MRYRGDDYHVMGNGNVRTNQAGLELIGNAKVADVIHTCAQQGYGLTGSEYTRGNAGCAKNRPANRR